MYHLQIDVVLLFARCESILMSMYSNTLQSPDDAESWGGVARHLAARTLR